MSGYTDRLARRERLDRAGHALPRQALHDRRSAAQGARGAGSAVTVTTSAPGGRRRGWRGGRGRTAGRRAGSGRRRSAGSTGSVRPGPGPTRSARRHTVRATCSDAASGVPPGRMKAVSGGICASRASMARSRSTMRAGGERGLFLARRHLRPRVGELRADREQVALHAVEELRQLARRRGRERRRSRRSARPRRRRRRRGRGPCGRASRRRGPSRRRRRSWCRSSSSPQRQPRDRRGERKPPRPPSPARRRSGARSPWRWPRARARRRRS